ncbi:NADH dehydrogenase [ubiquinone] 1 alpha subcomplex assembly factor 3 [Halocaridina rubra]|uniref:NADH dehydrogenase [ubiquinone] 1 alpha subcomplex assembly factor 3 n=1 Tax=Halocaridina rubra TaxID=373956 RepID=A0AAN8XG90_HALRR
MMRATFNKTLRMLAPRWGNSTTCQLRCYCAPGAEDKTIAKVLNQEIDSGLMIDAYSQVGFRLNNGMSVFGSIAIFPKSVLCWKVKSAFDITEDSLSLFCLLEPKIDILVIGVGDAGNKVEPRVIQYLRNKGINVEVLPTESACTTFNFLNDEKRYVAAALIPPISLRPSGDDLVKTQIDQRTIFRTEDDVKFL